MNDDYKEGDYETDTDEESVNIRRLQHELRSVSKTEDKKLFLWLGLAFLLIASYVIKPSYIGQIGILVLVPLCVLGGLGSVIFQNIRRKRNILIKHGLKCQNYGFIPSALNAAGVLGSKKCIKCHSSLDIYQGAPAEKHK